MDIFNELGTGHGVIKTVDMHTSGEPTRIVVEGYPQLQGDTLLEKRSYAREMHDDIRELIMREPRGHAEMYGAILVRDTELTASGEADMGVLFCHNEGYSTMCGHATIALGRFLVDTHDAAVFPRRAQLPHDAQAETTEIRLHAPCGVVRVCVPTAGGRADGSRPVSFEGVPSFLAAGDVVVAIPAAEQWGPRAVCVDIGFGGAFYAIVTAAALGFPRGLRAGCSLAALSRATAALKRCLAGRRELFRHAAGRELEYLYGVMVVDGDAGLCFFADQQVDRSPTGSCVCAQAAIAVERGQLALGETRRFESVLSPGHAFSATPVARSPAGVVVRVAGRAFYTAAAAFVLEPRDPLPVVPVFP